MKIIIAGGTGLVGRALTKLLRAQQHEVTILTRGNTYTKNGVHYLHWLDNHFTLPEADAVVNLAGVSLNSGRWTTARQNAIYTSRIQTTATLIKAIENSPHKPSVLINASAVGIYPVSTTAVYSEADTAYANDFLGTTVHDWERMASNATRFGTRVAYARFGVILAPDGGALPLMSLPFKLFAGGSIGSGEQWLSWVHIDDVARAILFAITTKTLNGAFNVVAPVALRMRDFSQVLAEVLAKPHWLTTPSFALQLALGEQSKLVLQGQKVLPQKLLQQGFIFNYPNLQQALQAIYL